MNQVNTAKWERESPDLETLVKRRPAMMAAGARVLSLRLQHLDVKSSLGVVATHLGLFLTAELL